LLFLLIEISRRGPIVNLPHTMDLPRVIKNTLGSRGLTRVDVSGNANVSDYRQV